MPVCSLVALVFPIGLFNLGATTFVLPLVFAMMFTMVWLQSPPRWSAHAASLGLLAVTMGSIGIQSWASPYPSEEAGSILFVTAAAAALAASFAITMRLLWRFRLIDSHLPPQDGQHRGSIFDHLSLTGAVATLLVILRAGWNRDIQWGLWMILLSAMSLACVAVMHSFSRRSRSGLWIVAAGWLAITAATVWIIGLITTIRDGWPTGQGTETFAGRWVAVNEALYEFIDKIWTTAVVGCLILISFAILTHACGLRFQSNRASSPFRSNRMWFVLVTVILLGFMSWQALSVRAVTINAPTMTRHHDAGWPMVAWQQRVINKTITDSYVNPAALIGNLVIMAVLGYGILSMFGTGGRLIHHQPRVRLLRWWKNDWHVQRLCLRLLWPIALLSCLLLLPVGQLANAILDEYNESLIDRLGQSELTSSRRVGRPLDRLILGQSFDFVFTAATIDRDELNPEQPLTRRFLDRLLDSPCLTQLELRRVALDAEQLDKLASIRYLREVALNNCPGVELGHLTGLSRVQDVTMDLADQSGAPSVQTIDLPPLARRVSLNLPSQMTDLTIDKAERCENLSLSIGDLFAIEPAGALTVLPFGLKLQQADRLVNLSVASDRSVQLFTGETASLADLTVVRFGDRELATGLQLNLASCSPRLSITTNDYIEQLNADPDVVISVDWFDDSLANAGNRLTTTIETLRGRTLQSMTAAGGRLNNAGVEALNRVHGLQRLSLLATQTDAATLSALSADELEVLNALGVIINSEQLARWLARSPRLSRLSIGVNEEPDLDLTGTPGLKFLELVGVDRFAQLRLPAASRLRTLSVTSSPLEDPLVPEQMHLRGQFSRRDFDRLDLSEVATLVLDPVGWDSSAWRGLDFAGAVCLDLRFTSEAIAERASWRFSGIPEGFNVLATVLRGDNLDLADTFGWVAETLPNCRYVDCRCGPAADRIDWLDVTSLNGLTIHLRGLAIEPPQIDSIFDWSRAGGQIWGTTRICMEDCSVSPEAWQRLVTRHRSDGNDEGESRFVGDTDVYLRSTPLSIDTAARIDWPGSLTLHQLSDDDQEAADQTLQADP